MTDFHSIAQDRADEIKARRSVEAREAGDVFDTRPCVLRLVTGPRCGHRHGAWICIAEAHSETSGHYFTREENTP